MDLNKLYAAEKMILSYIILVVEGLGKYIYKI